MAAAGEPLGFLEANPRCMAAVGQAVMIPKRDVTDRNVHCPSFWYLDNANNTWAMPLVNMAIHTQCYIGTVQTDLRAIWVNRNCPKAVTDVLLVLPTKGSVTGVTVRIDDAVAGKPPRIVESSVLDVSQVPGLNVVSEEQFQLPNLGPLNELLPGLFRLPIKAVPAGATLRVNISILENLDFMDGRYIFNQELQYPALNLPSVHDLHEVFALSGELAGVAPSIRIFSSTLELRVEQYPSSLRFTGRLPNNTPVDFNLSYSLSSDYINGTLIRQANGVDQQGRESGHFALFVTPPGKVAGHQATFHRCIVFVIDKSGSMAGRPWNEAVRALSAAMNMLGPYDHFNVICFDDTLEIWSPQFLRQAVPEVLANARAWLDTQAPRRGGTNLMAPLEAAVQQLQAVLGQNRAMAETHISSVFLITDGAVENEVDIFNSIKDAVREAGIRIMTFGIGTYCNFFFLQRLAEQSRGWSQLCVYSKDLFEQVTELWRRCSLPVLVNLDLVIPGLELCQMFPNPLPDLGQNQPLLVSGRYLTRPGLSFPERLALTGKFPNNQPLELPLIAMTMDSLPVDKVCAIQQIDLLTSRFWLTGVEAQKETVIELACEQNLGSKFTTMVGYETTAEQKDRFHREAPVNQANETLSGAAGVVVLGAALIVAGSVAHTMSNHNWWSSSGGYTHSGDCGNCYCDGCSGCSGIQCDACCDCCAELCRCLDVCSILGDCCIALCNGCASCSGGCDCNC